LSGQAPLALCQQKPASQRAHAQPARASDLVARAAQVAPNEGFEACHSETLLPLRNTPQYHGGLSRGGEVQCRGQPIHMKWKLRREKVPQVHLFKREKRSPNPSQCSNQHGGHAFSPKRLANRSKRDKNIKHERTKKKKLDTQIEYYQTSHRSSILPASPSRQLLEPITKSVQHGQCTCVCVCSYNNQALTLQLYLASSCIVSYLT